MISVGCIPSLDLLELSLVCIIGSGLNRRFPPAYAVHLKDSIVETTVSPVVYNAYFVPFNKGHTVSLLHSFDLEQRKASSGAAQSTIDCLQQRIEDLEKLKQVIETAVQGSLEIAGINIEEAPRETYIHPYYGNTCDNGAINDIDDLVRHAKAYVKTVRTLDEMLRGDGG